ncbi:hypothetical protein LFZ31_05405, partial [Salmonella enterica subsp. enterica serovar Newport str. S09097]
LHDLNQACRYATHLIALREGNIVAQGAPKEIVTAELIEKIYGLRCMIIDDPVARYAAGGTVGAAIVAHTDDKAGYRYPAFSGKSD